jgi:hypothetical protein
MVNILFSTLAKSTTLRCRTFQVLTIHEHCCSQHSCHFHTILICFVTRSSNTRVTLAANCYLLHPKPKTQNPSPNPNPKSQIQNQIQIQIIMNLLFTSTIKPTKFYGYYRPPLPTVNKFRLTIWKANFATHVVCFTTPSKMGH